MPNDPLPKPVHFAFAPGAGRDRPWRIALASDSDARSYARGALRWLQRTRDYLLCAVLVLPLCLLAPCGVWHWVQTRLIFQKSGFFFSDTLKGQSCCLASFAVFATLMSLWAVYEVFWDMGYFNAPPFMWWSC